MMVLTQDSLVVKVHVVVAARDGVLLPVLDWRAVAHVLRRSCHHGNQA